MEKLIAYTDGASKGNPGKASIGFVIQDTSGKVLKQCGMPIENATCNVAEYMALITALIEGLKFGAEELEVRSDSLLLVRQMQGSYKVKEEWLKKLHFIARQLAGNYTRLTFVHISREKNKQADKLANSNIENTLL
ncbi:MAG TPA: ribonuclease HI family protein [bacterium]|jgi:ribonuclease HI|nr:ribonuclease HI family protein [bacterium]